MTREEVKKLLPIIQAFSEGQDIEYFDKVCCKMENLYRTIFL